MKNNKQCPNCNSYKTQSQRQMYLIMGIMCLSFGLLLILIPFIGLPLLVIGVASLIAGLIPGLKNQYLCQTCKNKFEAK